ncbi:MAG: hypothetical protein WD963_01985 [Candidatus Paceibacterota bacterium]
MDTFDTSEEVMDEIDIEQSELDSGYNFELDSRDQEYENTNEHETRIEEESGEKSIENEDEEKTISIGEFVMGMRGGNEEDWKLTYNEEGNKFDGKELFDQGGNSLTEVIRNSEITADKILEHDDLLYHLANNPEQPYMLPDWVERTEDREIIHVTVAVADKEGNVRYETWSHKEEIKKEEEKEKPLDKPDGLKVEEATLNLEINIGIDKQGEADKEALLTQSLFEEAEVVNEQAAEDTKEVAQSEENVIAPEISQINIEPVAIPEEVVVPNSIPSEEFAHINPNIDNEPIAVENITSQTEEADINQENEVNQSNAHEAMRVDIFETVEEKTIENVETVISLEERIIDLLKDEPQSGFVEEENVVVTTIESDQVASNDREYISTEHEQVVDLDTTIKSEPTISIVESKVEPITLEDRVKDLLKDEDEKVGTVSEIMQTFSIENGTNQTTQTSSSTEYIQEKNTEQVTIVPTVEVHITEEKPENKTVAQVNVIDVKSQETRTELTVEGKTEEVGIPQDMEISKPVANEIVGVSKETSVSSNQILEKVVADLNNKVSVVKAEVRTKEVKGVEKVAIQKEKTAIPDRVKAPVKTREAIVLRINRNEINNATNLAKSITLETQRGEKRDTIQNIKTKPLNGHDILMHILGLSSTELRGSGSINVKPAQNTNQEDPETKSVKSVPSMYKPRNLNGITLKIAA